MYDEMSWFISYRQFLIILHTLYFCAGKIRTYTLYFFYLFGHLPTNKVLYHAVFWWWWWWWWWWIVFVVVDRRKAFSLISSQDHCQRSSSSRISNASRAGYRITIFDLTQLWIIGLTEQCSIWNFSSMFSLFFHTFRQVLKFWKKTKYWSLKETGTSYK